ncbi:NAD(P)-binding protein [Favolaschia claudopus]|uniref:NAD(P)-binding protein n=1 Tax=Favolaschia claudopus TaxID=2862362 RepID=A0AAV9ZL84_9AGAR
MSTTIAIFGATGTLGKFVLQAIADSPQRRGAVKEIRILTRPQSVEKANTLARQYPMLSITVHPLSYGILPDGEESVTGLLPGFLAQDVVARAAKKAGVKLFVPSEFGAPTHSILQTPLPALTAEDPIPLGSPPFETTRYHVAAYIVELLLHRGVDTVANTIHVIRGVRRDRALVSEAGKTEWVPDV